jgi:transposase
MAERLEKSRFYWPRKAGDQIVTLTAQQLNWLLDGFDISRLQPHETLHCSSVL